MRKRSLIVGLLAAVLTAGALPTAAWADDVEPLIVGGHDATEEYSFVASLQDDGKHFCGGALIAPEWVVTAYHCVWDYQLDPTQITVRVGSLDHTTGGEQVRVADIDIHPELADGWVEGDPPHDIALLKLAAPVEATPIALGTSTEPGTETRLLGWGITVPEPEEDTQLPTTLQELDVTVLDPADCASALIDPDTELCTDSPGGDSGACLGDSGSPQIAKEGGAWVLLGATSRGPVPCGTKPSVYTDVVAHADWIDETLKGATR
jgi:secreted trypsin-like serine protease